MNLWDCGYDNYPTLENYLFSAVKLVIYADIDKYKYSRCGTGFDRRGMLAMDLIIGFQSAMDLVKM